MAKSSSKNAPKEVQEENPWKSWMPTQLTVPVRLVIVVQWRVVLGLMLHLIRHAEIQGFVDECDIFVKTGIFFLALVTLLSLGHFPYLCDRIPVNFTCCFFLTLPKSLLMTVIALVASASTAVTVAQMFVCNVFLVVMYSVPCDVEKKQKLVERRLSNKSLNIQRLIVKMLLRRRQEKKP